MIGQNKTTLRALSDAAFGQKYRLELMLAIGSRLGEPVSLSQLATHVDLGVSQIQGAFHALVDIGLLRQVASPDPRRKLYAPDPSSSAWRWAAEMGDRAA